MQLKALASGSLAYLIASVFSAFLPFLLLPILTSYVPPDEFGQLGIFQGMYTMFLALCGLSVSGAVVRQSYDLNRNEIAVFIFNVLIIMVLATSAIAFGIFLAGDVISTRWNISLDFAFYALFAASCVFTLNILLGQFQVNQKPVQYGLVQVSHGAVNVGFSLILVLGFGWGALGRVLGITGAAFAFGLLAIIVLKRQGRLRAEFNPADMCNALRFGIPLLPHDLGTFFINWFSLFVLAKTLDGDSVGFYTFAFQLSMLLGITCDAFNRAYVPWLFSLLKAGNPDDKRRAVALTYIYFACLFVVVAMSFVLAGPIIGQFFNAEYKPAARLVGWLVLGQAFGGCYLMVTNYLFYHRRTELLSMATAFSSVTSVVLLLVFVPKYGVDGAVLSFISARLFSFLLTWYLATRVENMPWASFLQKR